MSAQESALSQGNMERLLTRAKENLSRHGHVVPVLWVRFESGEEGPIYLRRLPGTFEERWTYIARLGITLRRVGGRLQEAVLVVESWFVEPKGQAYDPALVAPSQHPDRQEAIFVAGRNADKSRISFVLQPFRRDDQNRPVLGEVKQAQYNRPADSAHGLEGLLDPLFAEPASERKKEGA